MTTEYLVDTGDQISDLAATLATDWRHLTADGVGIHATDAITEADWFASVTQLDPGKRSDVAATMVNNPWRPGHVPATSPNRALFDYRQAVGIRNLGRAMVVRSILEGDQAIDEAALCELAFAINAERALEPRRSNWALAADTDQLTAKFMAENKPPKSGDYTIADSMDVPISELSASLRTNVPDTFSLCETFELSPTMQRVRGGMFQPELHVSYGKAMGLRVGLRAAQIAAGVAQLAQSVNGNGAGRAASKMQLAAEMLHSGQLGWQMTGLWQTIAASTQPENQAAFSDAFITITSGDGDQFRADGNKTANNPAVLAAKQICRGCGVRLLCAEWTTVINTSTDDRNGVSGGMSMYEQGQARKTADKVVKGLIGLKLSTVYADYLSERSVAKNQASSGKKSDD